MEYIKNIKLFDFMSKNDLSFFGFLFWYKEAFNDHW